MKEPNLKLSWDTISPLLDEQKCKNVTTHSVDKATEDRQTLLRLLVGLQMTGTGTLNPSGWPLVTIRITNADAFNPAIPFQGIYPASVSAYL